MGTALRGLQEAPVDRIIRLTDLDLSGLSDDELRERVLAVHQANVLAARASSAAFVEFAIPSEEPSEDDRAVTGVPIRNADMHRDWHSFLDQHRQAVVVAPIEHGKSAQIAIGKLLHRLGSNPNKRFAIISSTATQARKILAAIRAHIERNPLVAEVFPSLRRSSHPEAIWGQDALTVERTIISKDPSLQALGTAGPIVGSRLDGILLDDVLDFDNTRTPEGCAKTIEWFDTSVQTRCTRNGFIWCIGTPWALLDLLAELQKRKGWASRVYSAVENPDDRPDKWRPRWPEQWPLSRLLERLGNTLISTFVRKYLCRVRSDETSRFKAEWIEAAKRLGRGRTLMPRRPILFPRGEKLPCFTGVDLGTSKRKRKMAGGADRGDGLSVMFTIAIDARARRIPVSVRAGRWTGPEILTNLVDVWERYESTMLVEDNGTQAFLVQFAAARGIPVVPFTTDDNKNDETFGVDSIAVEFRSGLWVIPSGADGQTIDPELTAWISEMLHYVPGEHTGDRLMASWFAREGARSLIAEIMKRMPTMQR